jgi:ligand-binding SRPBCC domain-containing protein
METPDATFEITSGLAAPATDVWSAALSEEGINFELAPWMRMTMPRGIGPGTGIGDVPVGEPLGRSWLLLGRLLPIDYDDLCLAERGPGMRFLERSRLGSARAWEHERLVVPMGERTCELTDRVAIELRGLLRAIGGGAIAARIIMALFEHRHRRLRQRWGAA